MVEQLNVIGSRKNKKSHTIAILATAVAATVLVTAPGASAATVTWIDAAGGSWVDGTNWSGGVAPDSADTVADISTLNIGGSPAITLDGTPTIGHMLFGDTTPSANWTLNSGTGGPLTLSTTSGAPTITVKNRTTTINAALAGNDGLTKEGAGTLVLAGANTYTGITTLSGPVTLDYATSNTSKLDDAAALHLRNATVLISGGSHTEVVASTVIRGANTISRSGSTGTIQLNQITREEGGLINFSANGIATVDNLGAGNTPAGSSIGIIGGWATAFGTGWATAPKTGSGDSATGSTNGSGRANSSAWGASDAVRVDADESDIGSKTVHALHVGNGGTRTLSFASGATLSITSGGLMSANQANSINGGSLTTGMSTGELFIHTPASLTLGSAIVNNGATPTVLVKGGSSILTLTGDNTYTGATHVNAGTLLLDNGGSLANGNVTVGPAATLAGGTTGDGGTLNFNIVGDDADLVSIAGGTLDLTNLKFSLLLSGAQTLSEYVLANMAVGSSGVLGSSFASTALPSGWAIDYDGTALNPDAIVLTVAAVPEPTGLASLGLAAVGVLGLRRRK